MVTPARRRALLLIPASVASAVTALATLTLLTSAPAEAYGQPRTTQAANATGDIKPANDRPAAAYTYALGGGRNARVELRFSLGGGDSKTTDYRVQNGYARLIESVPASSSIRAMIYDATDSGTAVYNAYKKQLNGRTTAQLGHVQVVADAGHLGKKSGGAFAERLATLLHGKGVLRVCPGYRSGGTTRSTACIAKNAGADPPVKTAIMHTKLALLSRATDSNGTKHTDTVWISTSNFGAHQSAFSQSSVTIYGDQSLYESLLHHYFTYAWNGPQSDDVDRGNTLGSDTGKVSYFRSPTTRDALAQQLSAVAVPAKNAFEDCVVYASYVKITRPAIAKQLGRLAGGGCNVKLVTRKDGSNAMSASIRTDLGRTKIRYAYVHDKTVAIHAPTSSSGGTIHNYVFTGSQNPDSGGLADDELLVWLKSPTAFAAYQDHFRADWYDNQQ